jgi:hypothetical protein
MSKRTIVTMPATALASRIARASRVLDAVGFQAESSRPTSAGSSVQRGQPAAPAHLDALAKHKIALFGASPARPGPLPPPSRPRAAGQASSITAPSWPRQHFGLANAAPVQDLQGQPLNLSSRKGGVMEERSSTAPSSVQNTEGPVARVE